MPALSAPLKVELKNLWWDFRKVVEFIDDNREWIMLLLEKVGMGT